MDRRFAAPMRNRASSGASEDTWCSTCGLCSAASAMTCHHCHTVAPPPHAVKPDSPQTAWGRQGTSLPDSRGCTPKTVGRRGTRSTEVKTANPTLIREHMTARSTPQEPWTSALPAPCAAARRVQCLTRALVVAPQGNLPVHRRRVRGQPGAADGGGAGKPARRHAVAVHRVGPGGARKVCNRDFVVSRRELAQGERQVASFFTQSSER